MPFCSSCGSVLKEEDKFCANCGTACIKFCAGCGSQLAASARFCSKCGQPVGSMAKEVKASAPAEPVKPDVQPVAADNKEVFGKCFKCARTFKIPDDSEDFKCPCCGEVLKRENSIEYLKKISKMGRLNVAELPYLQVGDVFLYGDNYLRKWTVLGIYNGFVYAIGDKISSYAIPYIKDLSYNDSLSPVTWETCSLRKWLNGPYLNDFFTKEEKEYIVPVRLANSNNPYYGTIGGNETVDKVFCLSIDEMKYYCENIKLSKILKTDDTESFWLRSPGKQQNEASANNMSKGFMDAWLPNPSYPVTAVTRNDFYDEAISVRPCICLNVSNLKRLDRQQYTIPSQIKNYNVGDAFTFGFDPFTGPVEWLVISKVNDQLMVISKEILRRKRFYINNEGAEGFYCTWETSDIRKWLNGDFYNQFFNNEERAHIIPQSISNNKTKFRQDYLGGNPTLDNVFLLSLEEKNALMPPENKDYKLQYDWWLRTSPTREIGPEDESYDACSALYVPYWKGEIPDYGKDIHDFAGVRPVMWVKIDEK